MPASNAPTRIARIGCAGWSIPRQHAHLFGEGDSLLARYASRFDLVEVNSSFYRPHQRKTWERWAASVPPRFRFTAKLPQEISHERALRGPGDVAAFLAEHPAVSWVNYPTLPDSPYRDLAARYLPLGAGAVFTFGVRGGRDTGARFIEELRLISHLANIGDAKTLIIHPASTTHQQLTDEQQIESGVSPDLVRISVGIEDADDICRDLDRALTKAAGA